MKPIPMLCVTLLLGACSTTTLNLHPEFNRHALVITGDGQLQAISSPPPVADQAAVSATATYTAQLSPMAWKDVAPRLKAFFEDIGRQIDAQEGGHNGAARKLLLFFHGGLNALTDSAARTNRLICLSTTQSMQDFYPVTVNWDSGLWQSYGEHLFSTRQGQPQPVVAVLTSPAYLLADLGRGVVRAPIAIGDTTFRDLQAIPWFDASVDVSKKDSDAMYRVVRASQTDADVTVRPDVSLGRIRATDKHTVRDTLRNVLTWVPQLVLSPTIDGFGTPAWQQMQRRAKMLYNVQDEFGFEGRDKLAREAADGHFPAVMTVFRQQLVEFARQRKAAGRPLEITIVAHSMGTFIVNDLLRTQPDLPLRNLVYMAGADSVRATRNAVFPFMRAQRDLGRDIDFYNLSLHPQNEVEEAEFMHFAPRGSLLVWIDDFFSTPETPLDRTVGRWNNVIKAYGEIPTHLRPYVHLKAFNEDAAIVKHGDFGKAQFWRSAFWQPGPDGQDPWPVSDALAMTDGVTAQTDQDARQICPGD